MMHLKKGYIAEYMRISDDDGDIKGAKKESDSIRNQRDVLQYFISQHTELSEYPVKEFLDDGFSGVNFNRPGVQELLKEVREGKIVCIVVKDLSRFGRNYIEVGDYIEQIFPFLGVRFISVSDCYDSFQYTGGIEVAFKNLIHDLYSRDLSKKVKSVKRMHQEQGVYFGGDVPYGYRKIEKGRTPYQPDPDASEIVQKIFAWAVEGNTPVMISKFLNEEGIQTPGLYKNTTKKLSYALKNTKSNLWTPAQVRKILQDEVYIGTFICRKTYNVRPKEIRRKSEDEYLRFENAHEALVSRDIFLEAQNAIQTRKKRGTYKKDANPQVLRGKVKCGYCGYSMSIKRPWHMYYCRMGDSCGSHLKVDVNILEETVLELLRKMMALQSEEAEKQKKENIRLLSEIKKARNETKILEMKVEHCKSNRLTLYRQWKEQQITKEEYLSKRDTLTKQESECQVRLQSLKGRIELLSVGQAKGISDNSLQKYSVVEILTKELADNLIERIDVYDNNRVEITWKFCDENVEFVKNKKS